MGKVGRRRKYQYSSERYKAYRQRHPERFTAEFRRASRTPTDVAYRKTQEYRDAQKKYRSGDVYRNAQLKAKYGITLEDYNKLLAKQNYACAVCLKPLDLSPERENKRHIAVDHDHATGAIRGILHRECNIGIGWFKDDPTLMRLAAEYIEKYQESLKDVEQPFPFDAARRYEAERP